MFSKVEERVSSYIVRRGRSWDGKLELSEFIVRVYSWDRGFRLGRLVGRL